ncbi:hypothetical protein, partial [Streptomyces sparsus]
WLALRRVLPRPVRRLVLHEVRAVTGLARWVTRRGHGVPPDAYPAGYAGAQAMTVFVLVWVLLIETVVLALLIPWPTVHLVVLVLDGYGLLTVVALHASCVVRPHVVEPDGSLRLRYGALLDLRVEAGQVASLRVVRRCPGGAPVRIGDGGVLDLAVDGRTSLSLELSRPVTGVRPMGRRFTARTVHFHADDPDAVVAAFTRATSGLPRD